MSEHGGEDIGWYNPVTGEWDLDDPTIADDLVDTVAAALAVDVTPSTIRSWAQRGKIERAGTDSKGRSTYSLTAVRHAHSAGTRSSTRGRRK